MALKVYTSTYNGYNSARVLVTLFEVDAIDYEQVQLSLGDLEHETPEHKERQPFGKVPALVDGDLTLFESRAIARYLVHKFEGRREGTPLYGNSLRDWALVEQWLEVEAQNYNPPIFAILFEKAMKGRRGEKIDEALMAANVDKLRKTLDVYEAHLTENKYLAGDFLSLADLVHMPETNILISWLERGDLIEARPHVKAWWDDISSLQSWKRTLALMRKIRME